MGICEMCRTHPQTWLRKTLRIQLVIPKCVAAARTLVEHFKKREVACKRLGVKKKQKGTKENILEQRLCHVVQAARIGMANLLNVKNKFVCFLF